MIPNGLQIRNIRADGKEVIHEDKKFYWHNMCFQHQRELEKTVLNASSKIIKKPANKLMLIYKHRKWWVIEKSTNLTASELKELQRHVYFKLFGWIH